MNKQTVRLIAAGLFLAALLMAANYVSLWRQSAAAQGFTEQTFLPLVQNPGVSPPPPETGQEPYIGAPSCPSHDDLAFHGLWDGVRGCHHNHTHYDDPRSVDDIFGTDYYTWAGGEISYPWQTFSSAGTENELKHGGYGWLVRRDLDCTSLFGDGCVRAFRAQFHGIGSNQGAYVRHHSYWLEALVCPENAPDDCGIIRVGGWQDTGDLRVDDMIVIDEPDNGDRFKLHYSGPALPNGTGNSAFGTWYSSSPQSWAQIAVQFEDMWGLINREGDASDLHFFCEDFSEGCVANGSKVQPHVISVLTRPAYRNLIDPDQDGKADYNGYVDQYGIPAQNCSEINLTCVPLVLENVTVGVNHQYRGDTREYDIYFNDDPSGWIDYPN